MSGEKLVERLEQACDDLCIPRGANDETPLVLLDRVMKAAIASIANAGRTNVRAGLLRQERDILKDEVEQLQARLAEAEGVVRPFAEIGLVVERNHKRLGIAPSATTVAKAPLHFFRAAASWLAGGGR